LNLIDTNVFVEILLGRGRAKECKELLDRISRGEADGAVTHFAIHAIEAIMGRNKLDISPFLRTVEQSAGLIVYDTSVSDEVAACILMREIGRDFDDALQYYVAKKLGVDGIVTFDKDFEDLDIPRYEPKDLA
jgi:predicted nucleic acid-binding protein